MKIVSKNEFRTFAKKYFPGKPIVYEDKYAYIQAGSSLGTYLHYECTETYVTLHIEGPNWRPIRDYLKSNLSNKRLTPSWWDRQNCQWTIDNEIHTADDLFQAFLDIRAIIEPVIERFEGKEPQDYTHYVLSKAEDNTPTPTEEIKEEKVAEKEKYKQHYSQSFENLLDTEPTKKVGVLSKLFRSESYKKSIDAEKTIKLMIYRAKADGKLSLQEKEYLTNNILQTFKEGYTSENRQQFIDLLNSKSLPGLTQDDVTFSSPNELNIALDKLVKLTKYDGEVTSEERTLLEKIAIMTSSEDYLKKKYNNIF